MALPLVFDFYNSIIEVPAPDTTLDVQYLLDQIRDTEDELTPGMAYPKIANASGKDSLGGGVYTVITVTLLDNWRVRFEARAGPSTEQMIISGGNLVGGPGGNPIAPSAYTQVVNLSSVSGTIATPTTSDENTNIKYLMASLSATDKSIGNIYYWDPVSGNDSNTGLTPTTAVQTFAKAHDDLVTAGNHDIVFCLASDSSGVSVVDITLSITKATLKVKGPGYVFQLTPTSPGSPTISISADNVEISGLYVTTAAGGTDNAITSTADNLLLKDCWIEGATGNGVDVSSAARTIIDTCAIENCTGNGINMGATTTQSTVEKCIITGCANGVELAGSGLTDNIFENNLIYNNTGDGIGIGTGVVRTGIRLHHTFSGNATNINDSGTSTFQDTSGAITSGDIDSIVSGVWDEVLTAHTTANSAAKILKDAKTKATLASLK